MPFNRTDLDIKHLKVRLPYPLRSHKDFENARIQIDRDQIHFHLIDPKTNLPELWVYYSDAGKWAHVTFLADRTDPQV